MNKTLRFSIFSIMMMLCGSMFAGSIVFGNLGLENGVQYTSPFDGGDFTVTFAGGGNDGKYYTTGSGIRVYGDGTMTIKAKSGTLTKILITYDGSNKPESADVVNVGSYDKETGMWTGNASEVVFTRPSGSGHWRVKAIATGDDAQGPDKPTEGQTPETSLTVARALEIINGLADGATTDFTYYVKGKVVEITNKGTTFSFTIGETADATTTITAYRLKGLENKDIVDQNFMKVGDDVVLYGVLMKYVKDQAVTPEVTSGYVYSVNGKTKAEEVPEPTIEGGTTPETAITVAAAVAAINTMVDGQTTKESYYVKGFVTSVTEISTANGNATFVMADEEGGTVTMTVFRAKGLENKNITEEEYVQDGDEVIVYGKLQKYVKNESMTPEMTNGYIHELNGKTKEDDSYVYEGDGTKDKPYTVADLKHMAVPENTNAAEGQEQVWVKGYIVGSLNSSGNAILEGENIAASNIGLGATADETDGAACIPVQLSAGNIRTALNVLDNPENVSKEVMVYGYILKYMSKTGVKNVSDYILDGEQYTTGINEVNTMSTGSDVRYNLAGQRINGSYKGIVISNGKKIVVK